MSEKNLSPALRNMTVAKKFFNENNIICFQKHIYYYHEEKPGEGGIWRLESDENTEAWIVKVYQNMYFTPPTTAQIREVVKYLSACTYNEYRREIKDFEDDNISLSNTMNIQSGILDLDTLKIKKYEKSDFCFHKLPFDYIKDFKCPVLMQFLHTSLGYNITDTDQYGKLMRFIQEWMGYIMVRGNKLQKALILYGDGANGKGVLTDIMQYIIGRHNCSFVDLKYINDGSQIFMTRNKLVNFGKDLESGQQLDTGIMKSAVAGETVVSNEKYKGQTDMSFTAKFIMSCNSLPYLKNAGVSVKRRFQIIPFTRSFSEEEQDKDLYKKLIVEAPHIFSWAVEGYKNLKKRGHFDIPDMCNLFMADYLRDNDSIQMWLDENCKFNEKYSAKTDRLFKDYQLFCLDSGMKSYQKGNFYKRLELKEYKRGRDGKTGDYCFSGFKLINDI